LVKARVIAPGHTKARPPISLEALEEVGLTCLLQSYLEILKIEVEPVLFGLSAAFRAHPSVHEKGHVSNPASGTHVLKVDGCCQVLRVPAKVGRLGVAV